MNPNAEKWVAALESGEYKQGREKLHSSNDEFCCLGVACDLAVKADVIPPPLQEGDMFEYNKEGYFLPESVKNWLGLRSDQGTYYDEQNNRGNLANDNDENGLTFAEIAQIIRKHEDTLFT